jgi:methylase of polypeptide subunit release factors
MKLTREDALRIVQERLDTFQYSGEVRAVVMPGETMERETYFVVFWQSEDYLKSGDYTDMIVGNAPYIVDKKAGDLYSTGTAEEIEHYMAEYEAGRLEKEEG